MTDGGLYANNVTICPTQACTPPYFQLTDCDQNRPVTHFTQALPPAAKLALVMPSSHTSRQSGGEETYLEHTSQY